MTSGYRRVGGKMVPWNNLCLWFASFGLAAVVSGFPSPTQLCLEVEVTGAVNQQDFNGYYRLDRDYWHKCSQRQAWTSNTTSTDGLHTYIYYLQEGFDGWVIARSSCIEWGNFLAMVRADVQTPFNVTSENWWKEYSDVNKSMVANDRLTVTCVSVGEDFCGSFPCAQGESCINLIDGCTCHCTDNTLCSSGGRNPTTHIVDIGSTKHFVLSATTSFSIKVAILSTLIVVILVLIACLIIYQIRRNKRNTEQVEHEKPRRIYYGNDQVSYSRLEETDHQSTGNLTDRKSDELSI